MSPRVDSADGACTNSGARRSPSMSMSELVDEEERHMEGLTRPDSDMSYAQDDVFKLRGNQRDVMSASSRHDHSVQLDLASLPPLLVFQSMLSSSLSLSLHMSFAAHCYRRGVTATHVCMSILSVISASPLTLSSSL